MNAWAVEALAIATKSFKRCHWVTMVHQRSYDTRGAQPSSDRVVGSVEPEEDCSIAERPATTRVCCSATTQRHNTANAELRAN